MIPLPPRSTLTDPLFPYTTHRRSRYGIDSDPAAAITTAGTVPPEDWDPEQFGSIAVVLFALSQTGMPQERIEAIVEILGVNRDEILPAFTDETSKTEATRLNLRGSALSVSYGCIELVHDDFAAKIRTPYSLAGNRCVDLPSAPGMGRGTALPAPHPSAKHPKIGRAHV